MSKLTEEQFTYLTALRQDLHRWPEISGDEIKTSDRIANELSSLGADQIWRGLGGHGVAAAFNGQEAGPTVLLRCELDGLPIREISDVPYKSKLKDKGHLCGHDGHMASLLGVAMGLSVRPKSGRVILLFQPAEETGAGAQAVIADPQWPQIQPDYAFAYHNVPGRPIGEIGVRPGPGNCASRGMKIRLEGKSAHAAEPENGVSPGPAMAALMTALTALSEGTIDNADFALVTLTHVELGEAAFGISPANGEVWVTLRSMTDTRMQDLIARATALVEHYAQDLNVEISWHDVFMSVVNDEEATSLARDLAISKSCNIRDMASPMRWSEDFGRFGENGTKSCLLYVGAGENLPQLHNPNYDFPDALIPITSDIFLGIVERILGGRHS